MPTASNRDKTAKGNKKLGGSRMASNETPVSSKEKPAPGKSKTGNTKETRPEPKAAKVLAKPAAPGKPAKADGKSPKASDDHTEATGRDHPSQSEHAHRLYEKLHGTSAERTNVPGQKVPGKKGGFDQHQFRGNQRGFGGGGNMIRRTQSRGGGSGGGGGGGGSGGA
jgi:hypothetical protein